MSQYANVSSIDVLKNFRVSLVKFAQVASGAFDEASSDIQSTSVWLRNDQYRYWKKQLQTRNELFIRAKLALKRKKVFERSLSGSAGSCLDEEKALQKAEKRLREAEHKFSRVKAWSQRIEKEASDYRSTVQGLVRAIEVDIPNSRAKLDKMIDALEAYIALAPPQTATAQSLETNGSMDFVWSDVTRPTEDKENQCQAENLKQKGKALRKITPSSRIRSQVQIDMNRSDWIAKVEFSEALLSYIVDCVDGRAKTQSGDKVVVALPKGIPDMIYLERIQAQKGDSGWYIGVGNEAELEGYVSAKVSYLVKLYPALTEIFSLPVGYLIMAGITNGAEAVLDPNGNVKWCTSEGDNPGSQ